MEIEFCFPLLGELRHWESFPLLGELRHWESFSLLGELRHWENLSSWRSVNEVKNGDYKSAISAKGQSLRISGVNEVKNGDYKSAISAKGQPLRISGLYSGNRGQRGNSTHFRMEHSALNGSKSEWKMEVKFRPKGDNVAKWQNISVHYPGATTEIDHNFITLTIPWPEEEHEFAVFGTPEKDDKKRMQLGIFGESLAKGKNASFHAVLFDDTLMAFENVSSKEESEGRHLLTTLGGLFVSISDEDIKTEVSGLESGFELQGSSVQTIKSKDAWNTPQNSTDFPYCVFEIRCLEEMEQPFLCEITATHEKDSTKVVVVAPLEQKNEAPFAG